MVFTFGSFMHFNLYCPVLELNDKKLHERVVNEMQNRWSDNLSKKSQGKEKISDSKCSWPLLSESSDRTFSHSHDYSGPS
ncbi:hypothetical protein CR513_46411, partial [Mucuna pruriens]